MYWYGVPVGTAIGAIYGLSISLDYQIKIKKHRKLLTFGTIAAASALGGALWPLAVTSLLFL